jgi:ribonuclease H / adenosylcobalamin/alpha-ribazole phosphatase
MAHRYVVVEADGGSRGNPGPAAYGAVLRDAETGGVVAEKAETIGVATNNVAEYRGLIAGLELYHQHADGAALEVRLDSKLIVEQMSGRWKIRHPDMRPLALRANRLAPAGTTYTWVPRAQNAHADRILNEALDGKRSGADSAGGDVTGHSSTEEPAETDTDVLFEAAETAERGRPRPPWEQGPPTTLVLMRHGETDHTRDRRFSGLGGADPGLNDDGRAQARATAAWLGPIAGDLEVVVTSPLRRTRETAEILAETLGKTVEVEEALAEASFGSWDGKTYEEARAEDEAAFDKWVASMDLPPGGHGESITDVDRRVRRARDRLIASYPGKTVLVVSHVTPIKLLVRLALDAPLEMVYRTELAPAAVSVLAWYPDGHPVLRMFNARSTDGFPVAQ